MSFLLERRSSGWSTRAECAKQVNGFSGMLGDVFLARIVFG
ncbi:hypothetical protein [Vibrio sp. OPT18]|nr:hypothetical protein [Vibrio sp. OPT18]